jgi:hypothetical protein
MWLPTPHIKRVFSRKGAATALEVKNACMGTSLPQENLPGVFREHNDGYKKRIGSSGSCHDAPECADCPAFCKICFKIIAERYNIRYLCAVFPSLRENGVKTE